MGVPKLRFKADDGSDFPDWEDKALGELFYISAGGLHLDFSFNPFFYKTAPGQPAADCHHQA